MIIECDLHERAENSALLLLEIIVIMFHGLMNCVNLKIKITENIVIKEGIYNVI